MARALAALGLAASLAACGARETAPVAPAMPTPPSLARADLFGDPARSGATLSPRGDRVAFLAPRDGVQNLWVMSVGAMEEARPLTDERVHGVQHFYWAEDNSTLLFLREDGGGAPRLYAVKDDGEPPRPLTPAGVTADVLSFSASDPDGVIVSLNQRDRDWPDLFRVDIPTSRRTLLLRNTGFSRFVLDQGNNVRLGLRPMPDGGAELASLGLDGRWTTLFAIPFEDAMSSLPIAFEADGRSFIMLDSTGRDRTVLVRVDATTGAKSLLGESPRSDVVDVWLDPATHAPEAFATEYLRREWRAIDADAQADLDFLDRQLSADFSVVSRSDEDARWIVVEEGPTTPARTYLYDRTGPEGRRLTLLFRHRPALEEAALQPMTPVEIESRDGLTLVSYLTLPVGSDADGNGRPDSPAPLVVVQRAGPWDRSRFGFDAVHQWLSNRGYAALSINTRGSSGFGKAFLNAGNREWGGRVQHDIQDAVAWAVTSGIARADHVAIMGEGMGGHAALSALAFAPEQFRCGASFGGYPSLFSFVENAPASQRPALYARVGDARSAEGRQSLRERSPLFRANQMRSPAFLAIGARDAHSLRAETDQLAEALRARRNGMIYLSFTDEGVRLRRQENRLAYYAVLDQFLGACLGGRVEPVGAAFEGANLVALDGAASVSGLSAFARRAPPRPTPAANAGEEGVSDYAPIDAAPVSAPPLDPPTQTP